MTVRDVSAGLVPEKIHEKKAGNVVAIVQGLIIIKFYYFIEFKEAENEDLNECIEAMRVIDLMRIK